MALSALPSCPRDVCLGSRTQIAEQCLHVPGVHHPAAAVLNDLGSSRTEHRVSASLSGPALGPVAAALLHHCLSWDTTCSVLEVPDLKLQLRWPQSPQIKRSWTALEAGDKSRGQVCLGE